jgi:hypothetical protein
MATTMACWRFRHGGGAGLWRRRRAGRSGGGGGAGRNHGGSGHCPGAAIQRRPRVWLCPLSWCCDAAGLAPVSDARVRGSGRCPGSAMRVVWPLSATPVCAATRGLGGLAPLIFLTVSGGRSFSLWNRRVPSPLWRDHVGPSLACWVLLRWWLMCSSLSMSCLLRWCSRCMLLPVSVLQGCGL